MEAERTDKAPATDEKSRPKRARTGPLSKREREVFELLAGGLSGAQIAEQLVLSPETVRTHIRNAMAKLGASTRSQAVVLALRRREITASPEAPDASRPLSRPAPRPAPNGDRLDGIALAAPLESAVDGLMSLWDVDAGWIYLSSSDGLGLRQVAQRAREPTHDLPETIPLGEGAVGRAALERRAQIVPAPGAETGTMILAPLLDSGRMIGVLGLAIRPARATGRQELLLLQALAGRLAELISSGGPHVAADITDALDGFRTSWTSATRPV